MRGTLPSGVVGPFFVDDFGDVYGVIYALQADGFSPAELKKFADDVRQKILRVQDVAKVELFGVQDEKVYIEISQKKLAGMGLDMGAIIAQLSQQNAVESAGTLNLPKDAVQLRVNGQFNSLDSLRQMPIRGVSGQQIKLGDLGTIKQDYIDPPSVKVRHNGESVIGLGVSMAKGGDIIDLGKALKVSIADIEKPCQRESAWSKCKTNPRRSQLPSMNS